MAVPTECEKTGVVDLAALLDAGEGAVVTLVAGQTRLAAHRAVLSATSPVFAVMFRHDTLEVSSGEVVIQDVEGPVLRQMVAYMYTGRTPQLPGMAHPLLAAADKYNVEPLKASCEQQVVAQLDLENAAAAAVLAVRHSCPTLREAAVNFVRAHGFQVMATQGWAEAVRRQPEDMVEFSRLLSQAPPESSATAASTAASATAPTAADAPQPKPRRQTPPPDAAAVSRFRYLSEEEKGRRLREAAKKGAVEEVRALVAAGADVGARDGCVAGWSMTALHWAAFRGHVEAAQRLLEAGAAVDTMSSWQWTPLLLAAEGRHAAVVRLLLAASADPNARTTDRRTSLHRAAYFGTMEVAAALLEGGADTGARDCYGDTPLDDARKRNHQEVVDLLRANT